MLPDSENLEVSMDESNAGTGGCILCLLSLSDTYNNYRSLSVAKTSTFSGRTLTHAIARKDYIAASFAAAISHLDPK